MGPLVCNGNISYFIISVGGAGGIIDTTHSVLRHITALGQGSSPTPPGWKREIYLAVLQFTHTVGSSAHTQLQEDEKILWPDGNARLNKRLLNITNVPVWESPDMVAFPVRRVRPDYRKPSNNE